MVLHHKAVFVIAPSVVDGGRVCQEIFDEANSESERREESRSWELSLLLVVLVGFGFKLIIFFLFFILLVIFMLGYTYRVDTFQI